jgi:hypothetical protein
MEWSTIPRVFQRSLGCKRESLTPLSHLLMLKMEVIHSSETSVHTRSTWRYIPEYSILHGHCCENLKTYKELTCSVIKISSFYQTPQRRFLPPFCLIMETSSFQNVVFLKHSTVNKVQNHWVIPSVIHYHQNPLEQVSSSPVVSLTTWMNIFTSIPVDFLIWPF